MSYHIYKATVEGVQLQRSKDEFPKIKSGTNPVPSRDSISGNHINRRLRSIIQILDSTCNIEN